MKYMNIKEKRKEYFLGFFFVGSGYFQLNLFRIFVVVVVVDHHHYTKKNETEMRHIVSFALVRLLFLLPKIYLKKKIL